MVFLLNEIDFIRKGIDALAPGRERKGNVTNRRSIGYKPDDVYPPVVITVNYKDSMGGNHDDEFKLDFNDVDLPA